MRSDLLLWRGHKAVRLAATCWEGAQSLPGINVQVRGAKSPWNGLYALPVGHVDFRKTLVRFYIELSSARKAAVAYGKVVRFLTVRADDHE